MKTLRDIWIDQGMTATEVAGKSGISVPTLYKMNRKESVNPRNAQAVCRVLGLSLRQYADLDACPMAERYRKDADL